MSEWEEKRQRVNSLVRELQAKPDSEKVGYSLSPGGILNAHREGDVTFDAAVHAIQEWALSTALHERDEARAMVAELANVMREHVLGFLEGSNPYPHFAVVERVTAVLAKAETLQ